jgi:hypothetical protein
VVQLRHPLGLPLLQAHPQQVGEQVVVAPPATHRIQWHQEQVGPLDRLQQPLAVGAAGDRIAQRPRQPLQHRGLQQEAAHRLGLALQHLLGQIVQHEPVAARKRRHKPGDIDLPLQRQAGQLQPGHPPLGARRQYRHGSLRQVGSDRPA